MGIGVQSASAFFDLGFDHPLHIYFSTLDVAVHHHRHLALIDMKVKVTDRFK